MPSRLTELMSTRQSPGVNNQVGPLVNNQLPGYVGQGVENGDPSRIDKSTGRAYIPEPYTYSLTFDIVGAATFNQSQNIQIQSDAEFILLQTQYTFLLNSDPSPSVLNRLLPQGASVQLNDSGSGRNLFNEAVSVPSVFGDGILPFIWQTPKAIAAASVLNVIVDTGATALNADDTTLLLVFSGEKRYYL